MASHDIAWDTFRDELRHWMDVRRMTSRALAQRLTETVPVELVGKIDENIVKRWRHSTSPPLHAVRHIAAILDMSGDPTGQAPYDPAFLIRRMGLLDERADGAELFDTTYRLQELRLRLMDARASLGELTARTGAGQLVQLAMSHSYAAAVYPVWEGPSGYPMHVADRLDFRPVRPGMPPVDENPAMRAALTESFAVPGRRLPRFSESPEDLETQSHWAIPLLGRPFSRSGQTLHPTAHSIAVSSSTTSAWGDDVGAMLAWILGYGFVSTREIARELTRNPLTAEPLRNEVHGQFLGRPPQRHVWSHHAIRLSKANPHAPFAQPEAQINPFLVHVRLVEDDSVLEFTRDWMGDMLSLPPAEAVEVAKKARDEAAHRLAAGIPGLDSERVLCVPVTTCENSAGRWEQAMEAVLATTHRLHELGVVTDLTPTHERLCRDEPDVAPTMFRWLADHGCPLVNVKFATEKSAPGVREW